MTSPRRELSIGFAAESDAALHEKGGERLIHPSYDFQPNTNTALNVESHRTVQSNTVTPIPGSSPPK